jgi:membrane protein implicated in regulation of membrane protease activity
MNWAACIWLILLVVFLAVEASTVTMVSLWFAAGAVTAMAVSLLGGAVWLQILVFLAVSAVLLTALRPLVRKHITPKISATNVDAVIGTKGLVTVTIDNVAAAGRVKLGGMEWSARSVNGDMIPEGTLVRVDRIEGVKVFVTPVEAKENLSALSS